MTTLGIVGSGFVGSAVARLAVTAGVRVIMANSRGPESLQEVVASLGPLATAASAGQAIEEGDFVLLAVPLRAVPQLPVARLAGKVVLDTSNYYPSRDRHIVELDNGSLTTSQFVQGLLDGARLVTVFNNIYYAHLLQLARPAGADDRTALPLTSDDEGAKAAVGRLLEELGFDPFDAGPLSESWRSEPGAAGYIELYYSDRTRDHSGEPDERGAPVSSKALELALAQATRVSVTAREQ